MFHILAAETRKARAPNIRLSCVAEQKVSDWQMNAWTVQTCDIVRDGMANDQY